jgi:hypothetical protein
VLGCIGLVSLVLAARRNQSRVLHQR